MCVCVYGQYSFIFTFFTSFLFSKHFTTTIMEKRLLLLGLLCAALLLLVQDATGSRVQMAHLRNWKDDHIPSADREQSSRRFLIGSVAPTCTYNECRGCRFKCRAEQVPVEGNDPINSAYHYKCVCHR
ncbi:uncharacterized protein LOC131022875 isoform X1 [Salvia miltiorrhiza]|uniref:uncharacterized protein LOC131022875 isoform X1 n=1 Tax=Salvia miltiorrhiza TaxID=226208 RepID=UPI0025AC8C25|nr:uncharacterized protein LOC131022875 isoform X1 [Salvia miltiorrhiza]